VVTQFNISASRENSLPIEGKAMLIEDPMKGMIKDPRVVTIKAGL
jgi:hypothetical protein